MFPTILQNFVKKVINLEIFSSIAEMYRKKWNLYFTILVK